MRPGPRASSGYCAITSATACRNPSRCSIGIAAARLVNSSSSESLKLNGDTAGSLSLGSGPIFWLLGRVLMNAEPQRYAFGAKRTRSGGQNRLDRSKMTQSGHQGAFRCGLPRAGRERKQPRVRREEAYDERCPSGRKASFRHLRRLARHNRITVSLDVLVNLLAQHSTFAKVKA
jgi:hypothetical protein